MRIITKLSCQQLEIDTGGIALIERFEQFVSYISALHRDIQKIEREEMERLYAKNELKTFDKAKKSFKDWIKLNLSSFS